MRRRMGGQMAQLTLTEVVDPAPELDGEMASSLYRAMQAIAGSTLLEFEGALAWGQWCRRTAAEAIRGSVA